MNEVWNLDPIYTGFDDAAFEADMQALKEAVEKIEAFAAELPGMEPKAGLREGIALQEDFSRLVSKLAGYASLRQAANTKDPASASQMGRIMALYSGVAAPFAAYREWAAKLPNLEQLVAEDDDLRDYAFLFRKMAESSKYLLPGIAEAVSRVVMAKLCFPFTGVEIMFYIEPVAWLMAWLFVLVPYYFYQHKRLPITKLR